MPSRVIRHPSASRCQMVPAAPVCLVVLQHWDPSCRLRNTFIPLAIRHASNGRPEEEARTERKTFHPRYCRLSAYLLSLFSKLNSWGELSRADAGDRLSVILNKCAKNVHASERVPQVAAQNENRRKNFVIGSPVFAGLMRSLKLAICFAVLNSWEWCIEETLFPRQAASLENTINAAAEILKVKSSGPHKSTWHL